MQANNGRPPCIAGKISKSVTNERAWLRFSNGTSVEGRALRDLCCSHGMEERVRKPTSGKNLLDLVLTDMGSDVSTVVHPGLSDHSVVVGTIDVAVESKQEHSRELYDFGKASWTSIRSSLRDTGWDAIFAETTVDTAAALLEDRLLSVLDATVPRKVVREAKSTHPWLNDTCRHAIGEKVSAVGTPMETMKRDECTNVLLQEQRKYVARIKDKLRRMPQSSRGWWRLAKALAGKRSKAVSVQALKAETSDASANTWARKAGKKAELLAATLERKGRLPDAEINIFSQIPDPSFSDDFFLAVRCNYLRRQLRLLKSDSSTSPDGIATVVLKSCAKEVAYPLALLLRKMLANGAWPDRWHEHWIVPLYKRGSRANPSNYRGVHLTSQMSKCAERCVGRLF